jgi:hypothetical protein
MKLICKQECDTEKKVLKGKGWTLFTGILLLFMPKCAFCWAVYMSVFTSLGLVSFPYQSWFLPVTTFLFAITLIKLLYNSIQTRNFISFILAMLAGVIIVLQKWGNETQGLNYLAIALMFTAIMRDKVIVLFRQLTIFILR